MNIEGLNPQQSSATTHLGSPLLVLAGAGSGKTRVITHKIAWLIRNAGYAAYQIAAITFTNKAAREMKERTLSLLSRQEAKGLTVSTFHTLGLTIIRSEIETLGYKPGFSIFDAQDSASILKELAYKEDNLADEDTESRWIISRWKNDFVNPEQALQIAENPKEVQAAILYEKYQRQLKAYNGLDFDDLIVLPTQLLENNEAVRTKWQNRLRYLLIDEYQDTNACQYRMIKLLAGVRGEITAVGDDDQSIYAWRGAQPENLNLLQQDYPMLKVVKLEQNYRSTEFILGAANHLIANNPHLFDKKLWSALGYGEKILIMPCRTAEHEAEKVITEILKYKFRARAEPEDFAILYRSNHQGKLFERVLRENNLPYRVTGGQSFFERAEVKDTLAYIRLIANPTDDAAFLRIVNTPKREIGLSTLEKLGTYAYERGTTLLAASHEFGFAQRISSRAKLNLDRFTDWIEHLIRSVDNFAPHEFIRQIINDIGYEDYLLNMSSSPKMAERRMDNVKEVFKWIERLYDDGDGKETLGEIVAHMTLMDLLERNREDKDNNEITLMTLHSSKGLEYPYVFIVGVEEDLIPHANSLSENEEGLEEERRLMYVGITRAKQQLTISYAKTRSRYGEELTCEPSRFLDELPVANIEWEDKRQISPEKKQENADAYMKDILAMLEE